MRVQGIDLVKIFRGSPPDQPARFYKLTREGQWLRGSHGWIFQAVKTASGRIRLPDDGRR